MTFGGYGTAMIVEGVRSKFGAVFLLVGLTCAQYQPNWDSINSRPLPSWYDEAKFGIFITWGVYSVPAYATTDVVAAEWYWEYLSEEVDGFVQYHERTYGQNFTYQEFGPMFKNELFNPDDWAQIIAGSGAKYVVMTTKHHDGYTLFPSPQSWGWNSVDVGPHKDLVAAVSKSIKAAGLEMGLYMSLFEWFNPLYLADAASGTPPTTDIYVQDVLLPQLYQIVNDYEPSVVWADGNWDQPSEYFKSTEFLAWLYNNATVKDHVVVNDRWGSETPGVDGGFFSGPDRYTPGHLLPHKWESCYTMGTSWGWNQDEPLESFQTTQQLLQYLVETVSCGGNLLLNVGPTSNGKIPLVFQQRLADIGEWMGVNGEAIYATHPWRAQNDTASEDVWYTTNTTTNAVYAISFTWPSDGTLNLVTPVVSHETKVELLGYSEPLHFTATGSSGVNIKLPVLTLEEYPPQKLYTFKLTNVK
eukprot:gene5915-6846_t